MRRIMFLAITAAMLVPLSSCIPIPWFDRPATVYIESGCGWRHVNSIGDEMDTLQLWHGRVVWLVNESDGRVVVHFPPDMMTRDDVVLYPGERSWVRVASTAEYGTEEYALECFEASTGGEPGEGTGIGGPKANVGDDNGDP